MTKHITQDGLINAVSGLGSDQDKATYSEYELVEPNWEQLTTAYRTSWMARKIVDIPVNDATREWRNWQADKDQISAIEKEEKRLKLKQKVKQARIASRLYGGSLIFIATGENDLRKELNVDRIGLQGIRYLTVLPPQAVTVGPIQDDPREEYYGQPKYYSMTYSTGQPELEIHPSRMVRFDGVRRPDRLALAGMLYGWEDSILMSMLEDIKRLDGIHGNVASLIYEAKIDIIKIPNLMRLVDDPLFEQKVFKRLRAAKLGKSNHNALIMDTEEEYDQKTLTFAQLPELIQTFQSTVSGASDIPATRLFGKSPDGMNSTGEGDQRNYYDMVGGIQSDIEDSMTVLDDCLMRSALGGRPEEIYYVWAPLWQPSDEQIADVAKVLTEALSNVKAMNVYSMESLEKICTNALTESGAFPGIEAAVTDFPMDFKEFNEDPLEMGVGEEDEPDMDENGEPIEVADAKPMTLYIHRPVLNATEIIEWAKSQGFKTTLPEDDMHVTIAFSRQPVDWMKVGQTWESEITVPEGGPRLMEQFGDARVLVFSADELQWRHDAIKEMGATWDHPEYQPHITISYDPDAPGLGDIDPYQGQIILGPEVFDEVKDDWKETIQEKE
jgi:phage-related protein (TIGR01555 family)